jgi:hypothetical protein
MQVSLEKIKTHITKLESELTLLEGGRKASSLSARKEALDAKNELHEIRKLISLHLHSLPTKSVNTIVFPEPTIPDKPEPVVEPVEPVVMVLPVKKARKKPSAV